MNITRLDIIRCLIFLIAQRSVQIRVILLDRAFYSADVIDFLQRKRIRFLMPAKQIRRIVMLLTTISRLVLEVAHGFQVCEDYE